MINVTQYTIPDKGGSPVLENVSSLPNYKHISNITDKSDKVCVLIKLMDIEKKDFVNLILSDFIM